MPDVAMDLDGDFVIAWESFGQDGDGYGIYAQQYDATGNEQGNEFQVNDFATSDQVTPSVSMNAFGGFVVTWTSQVIDGSSTAIVAQEYDASGAVQGAGEFVVNDYTTDHQTLNTVAMDAAGDFIVAWESFDQDGDAYGVYSQKYIAASDDAGAIVTDVFAVDSGVRRLITERGPLVGGTTGFVVTFGEELDTSVDGNGDPLPGSVLSPYNWGLTFNGSDVTGAIWGITFGLNATTNKYEAVLTLAPGMPPGDLVLTARDTILDVSGNLLDGDRDGTTGGNFVRRFHVVPTTIDGGEHQVNTSALYNQWDPVVATDADGDSVVVWGSYSQDGNGRYEIFAQRYNAAGTAVGSEFRVGASTAYDRTAPAVAMDADGDFVITWESFGQDGSGRGIYAQRYNAVGVAQGNEFLVNNFYVDYDEYDPSIAMDVEGDFVISWTSQFLGQTDVYARSYNADGLFLGETGTYLSGNDYNTSVAMNASGDFVLVWQSEGQDGDQAGIFAQQYNRDTTPKGTPFQVNTYTTGNQTDPSVAMDAAGDFIVTWTSVSQDGSQEGIYAQRFAANGAALGSELLINNTTADYQTNSRVAMDADGDAVITWISNGQDGYGSGIYATTVAYTPFPQLYEFQVNTTTTGYQYSPSVAMDASGNFTIVWQGPGIGHADGDIFAQRYDAYFPFSAPMVTDVLVGGETVSEGETVLSAVTTMTVNFSEVMYDGPSILPDSILNPANWTLSRDGTDISQYIQSITFGLNSTTNKFEAQLTFISPLLPGEYELGVLDPIEDVVDGAILDGNRDGIDGIHFVRSFTLASLARAGSEFQVNTTTTNGQFRSATAMDADGDYVVVWASYAQDGGDDGIYAQRFNAAGVAQGSEFQVNTYTTSWQDDPSVAMDADGDFVIAWESYGQDGSNAGIYARRYNAAGVAQGNEFRVNDYTTAEQYSPDVAMDAAGNFVIAWESFGNDGDSYGISAQRYSADGVRRDLNFQVNTYTTSFQASAAVTMDAFGDFVITWTSYGQDGGYDGVYGQRYNAAGIQQGSEFQINTHTTENQYNPDVAMDADGDFVVTWQSADQDGSYSGIYAQRFDATGAAEGTEFQVNTFTTNSQRRAQVAIDADGDFVVTWESYYQDGDYLGVFAQAFLASGTPQGSELQVNSTTYGDQRRAAVAMDAKGDFVVAWQSYYQDGYEDGIFAQRYNVAGDETGPMVSAVLANGDEVTFGERLVGAPATLTVTFGEDLMNVGPNAVINPANWTLTRDGVDVSGQIDTLSYTFNGVTNRYELTLNFATPLADGNYVLTASQDIVDLAGNALDGDFNGTPGGNFTTIFSVRTPVAVGGELLVNATSSNDQLWPDVASDPQGNTVVTWTSWGQDGDFSGIYAQRYDAQGLPVGTEFRVNTTTTNPQYLSSVAMDQYGDFVITWVSYGQDGDSYGIYAQRFDSDGVAQGGEFLVNTVTAGYQSSPEVAMASNGTFVISWASHGQDGDSWGVYAQRFAYDGSTLGSEFQVNTYTTGLQGYASVAMDANGDFVIAWQSDGQDQDGYGVYARRYNADGAAVGGEFRVSTYTTHNQAAPTVAMDADGDFVIAWGSYYQDSSFWGVYAQRYAANGTTQGSEFLVNTQTTFNQGAASVVMDADGDFVVSWHSYGQDEPYIPYSNGQNYGVYAQRFNAEGVRQGTEFLVNTYTTGSQFNSSVAMDADGDFTVVWQSDYQIFDGDIYAQRFKANVAPTIASGQSFNLAENSPVNTSVGTVIAVDGDGASDVLTYAITGGNTNGAFYINSATGEILVDTASAINYEVTPSFTLTITATDTSNAVATQTVTINLTNVNEAPVVIPQDFLIGENSVNNAYIWTMTATDQDLGQTRSFAITAGNTNNAFKINPTTGVLSVNNSAALNYESVTQFNLTITATDNGSPALSGSRAVTVYLRNENDAPVVTATQFLIGENSVNNAFIGTIPVSDQDVGQSRTYSIVAGNVGNAFRINATTGVLSVNNTTMLDYERVQRFDLVVRVVDNGSPAQAGAASVTVFLRNENDIPLVTGAQFLIGENSVPNAFIGVIPIYDQDVGQTHRFSIVAGNDTNAFSINPSTGVLSVNNPAALNYEEVQRFDLVVRVVDNGTPATANAVTVTVFLRNENDAPVVQPTQFLIGENSVNNAFIGTIPVYDQDLGQSRTYSIVAGNIDNAFAINPTTGVLTVNNSAALDYETRTRFDLVVRVVDNGTPAMAGAANVTVFLRDVLDIPRVVPQDFLIGEDSVHGAFIGTVVAINPDPMVPRTMTFAITGGNTNNAFLIDPYTGVFSVNNAEALDYETQPVFNLTVTVTDNSTPALSGSALVRVYLRDVVGARPVARGILDQDVSTVVLPAVKKSGFTSLAERLRKTR